ncbi:MAG: hypothetical protein SYR96_15845 [Actinomycetota bacterium]|nr:hypothetical protein [Actinomycetota bacterium]
MSESDHDGQRGRKTVAVVLSGLAAGALLGAAAADPETSIKEQFNAAYAAGPAGPVVNEPQIILGQ